MRRGRFFKKGMGFERLYDVYIQLGWTYLMNIEYMKLDHYILSVAFHNNRGQRILTAHAWV